MWRKDGGAEESDLYYLAIGFVKRILVNSRFLMNPVTGVQRYAREMVNALRDAGQGWHDLLLAVPGRVSCDFGAGIQVVEDRCGLSGHLWEQVRLPVIMRKTKADLLWSPCGSGPVSVGRQLVTIHDASVFACRRCFRWTYGTYYRTLLPLLSKRVLRVITVSEFSRSELVSYKICSSEKISVIHNGISAWAFCSRSKKAPLYGDRYVLSVGSRDPRKNISRLLTAWGMIPSDLKRGTKLVLAGGGDRIYAGERLEDLPGDVVVLGYVAEEDLACLYSSAMIFVYPSVYEGFGFPPLEAMACGTPTIVSNAASLPEICGDAALYCDPLDVGSIAEKLIQLLGDSLLQDQLRRKGLERIKQFTWQKAAAQLRQIFEEVLS
jgi:glycosyltransferase involved in cell wall biosynthesis